MVQWKGSLRKLQHNIIKLKDAHGIIPGTCEYSILYAKALCRYHRVKDPEVGRLPEIICVGSM
jgi:hypothetical protein